jgi:hypothetical protein
MRKMGVVLASAALEAGAQPAPHNRTWLRIGKETNPYES